MAHSRRQKGLPSTGLGKTVPTSFRFSEDAKEILYRLSAFEGLSQTSYMERLLRVAARDTGLIPGQIDPLKGPRRP